MKSCSVSNCQNNVWSKGKCWFHREVKVGKKKPTNGVTITMLDLWYGRYRKAKISKDGYISCFICNKPVKTPESQLMHYFGRSSLCLRFDKINTQVGCIECNQFKGGNLEQFKLKLVDKYGQETINKLIANSKKLCKLPQAQRRKYLEKWRTFVKNNPTRDS